METKRPISEGAEKLLGLYFPVLDNGFISLVDYMGNDESIEKAARVSYGAGTRKVSQTRGLLRYLKRHKHTSPYEMLEFKFHCCMPMFVARQWIRHRTASVNEYSGRYSLMPMVFYTPEEKDFKKQNQSNNQGRDDETKINHDKYVAAIDRWNSIRKDSQKLYEDLTSDEVARELARIDLPLSTYTQWYWKIDLHNLFHFLTLRTDNHAQYEIREFANVMAGMLKHAVPLSFEAWMDYDVGAAKISRMEMNLIREFLRTNAYGGTPESRRQEAEKMGLSKREVDEFFRKLSPTDKLPTFDLDLNNAKPANYFEEKMSAAVPKIDRDVE